VRRHGLAVLLCLAVVCIPAGAAPGGAAQLLDEAHARLLKGDLEGAAERLRQVVAASGSDARIVLAAELNLARLGPARERLAKLSSIAPRIASIADARARAILHLNLGHQAQRLGPQAVRLAYVQIVAALVSASEAADPRLEAEALAALASLYEAERRHAEAQALSTRALSLARALPRSRGIDLVIEGEWRVGRLARALGDTDLAAASYQRAVEAVEAARADIPIEYEDGGSSFRVTLEPVYLGYADLLFERLAGTPAAQRSEALARIRDVVELVRQAELQDYLRDRCEVEAIQRGGRERLPPGVAVLYPIVFADRIELLLETDAGIEWRTTRVDARAVRATATLFASDLRNSAEGYLPAAQTLYRWLLAPFEERLRTAGTLIAVPEGALRLVPFAALHDGRRFAIERFAVGSVTGLTMTNMSAPAKAAGQTLVAGMSVPGPVLDKLPAVTIASILGTRSPGAASVTRNELREALALPGVKAEVESIAGIAHGRIMLDEAFTAGAFQSAARSGDYRIVHIASHGVFGGSADASYIMAFDDVLSMRDLQSLLRDERFRRHPIELLSLSACQSAEGDDRSPLGISGAAVKARAKSVLGTLWPVEDDSARTVMEKFYRHLEVDGTNKVDALRRAQSETMRDPRYAHPFFWAPFVLIGNWL
jgi:CHAT domain-containing protein